MTPRKGNTHDQAAEVGLTCHWYDDGHGGRFLIPGCMTRVINPDVEQCSCKTVEEQLGSARREIAELKKSRAGLQNWHDAIVRAVYDHADGIQIMKTAADRAESGR